MLEAINYYFHSLRNPNFRDFVEMGIGIKVRHKKSKRFWDNHLRFCKEFQQDIISTIPDKKSLAVLGAGSLLDVNLEAIDLKFEEVDLYDADFSLKSIWKKKTKKLSAKFTYNFIDLTSSLDLWTSDLSKHLKFNRSLNNLTRFLKELKTCNTKVFNKSPDVILSVNLLSQIPIYWRDRVHKEVKRILNIDTDEQGNYPVEIQQALEESMSNLQADHLSLLSRSNSSLIILITDRDFLYYTSNRSEWQVEKALYVDKELDIENYIVSKTDSWFWHILPEGSENNQYGSIHDVCAKSYLKVEYLK